MIGVIDYEAGNLTSVSHLLQRIGTPFFVSENPKELEKAEKILFPGVGHAKAAMEALKKRRLDVFLKETLKPLLAICIGMQLLFQFSEEGNTECLGILEGEVKKFSKENVGIVPHMGWNEVFWKQENVCTQNIDSGNDFYFVHSFFCVPQKPEIVLAETEYGHEKFCSAITQKNITAVQFHPEKSGKMGENFLQNFVG